MRPLVLLVTLSTGLCAGRPLVAQGGDQSNANTQSSSESQVAITAVPFESSRDSEEQPTQFAAALNGSGLISMDSAVRSRLLLGTTLAAGWDSNPNSLENGMSSGVYTLSPYFGIQANSAKTQLILQYQPTITGYSSTVYSNQTFHVGSIEILRNINERWKWELQAAGSYGQDSTRFLAPQQTVVVGGVPGSGPNTASYIPNTGTVTYLNAGWAGHYTESERDSVEFSLANSFSQYSGLNENNGIASAGIRYSRALSSILAGFVYGSGLYYYGAINCPSFGGGIGLRWQIREKTSLSISGGPQISSSTCGNQQGFSYNAAFSTRLSAKSQIYLLAARQPATSYLGPGLWQVSASGGYQRQVLARGTLSFDVGYVSSSSLTTTDSYNNKYFDCVYSYSLNHGLSISSSYRGYVGDNGQVGFHRNVALFSLAWSPSTGKLFQ
jgi:hypothetical protein